ncbi:hypothetical protein DPMN_054698 [Dreissena polymorpha]|uniref:Uncharacterized protein n=1 Tax=Dreissena polymorpha TaxID=45954 RepID=A0A9D4CQD0_DREPO|nr:hypothetical protein DPMN_054698 [Dreissena polymorpha]
MIDHSQESKHATFVPEHTNELSHTRHMILGSDFCDKVICVGGVLLSRIQVSQSDMVSTGLWGAWLSSLCKYP